MDNLTDSLHKLERKVLPILHDNITLKDIIKKTGLKEEEITRALQWLENKELIKTEKTAKEIVEIDENGEKYLKEGFPEKRFLSALKKDSRLQNIKKDANLDDAEVNIVLGLLKKKDLIDVGNTIKLKGKAGLDLKEYEDFLKELPKEKSKLTIKEREIYDELSRRKEIIKINLAKDKIIVLTDAGRKIAKEKLDDNLIEALTPEVIKSSKWKNNKFRKYDIKVNVPKIYPGKRHPYNEFLNSVKEKLVNLGFKEMIGPTIETEFYNFDALFQPQNHPARDWTDTYRIKDTKYGDLPKSIKVKQVKETHENGWKTGSTGWNYKWSESMARQLMPRAHDTAISARTLLKGIKIPGKYFSLVRCYRPDIIDATHAVEFNQMGGFIIDENLNFTQLLGLLRNFAIEMTGSKEIKFFPDYYPFTEPSVQISVKHPIFGWLEIAGAGIFRPELTLPLGIKQPVIAWGFGVDRLAMLKLGIKDIRDLFSQNISYLRDSKWQQ